jgi:membrane fusion protein, multidrug efflux system
MDDSTKEGQGSGVPASSTQDWRARLRLALMLLGPAAVLAVAAYFYLTAGRFESTDDAYVQAARVAISADVGGRVTEVAVRDNQRVHKGEVLFRLDQAPFRIAVDEASARLAAARLKVEVLKANYRQRESDLASARETLKFEQTEYNRARRLSVSGIASQSQLDRATHALDDARARLDAVKQQIGAVVADLAGNPNIAPERHPEVRQAQALLDRAKLNLSYTVVTAPADGVVTRVEELQAGDHINAATSVFALVSAHDVWITANFKEDQLAHMRAGESATVQIDSYPGKTFRGKVASLSPGTGSQFSVLPPENATGNWVKVVQRLPVRIALDHLDPAFPLKDGLSADVNVDTRYQRHLFGSAEASSAHASGGAR